jgi:hypothetical protein
VDRTPPRTIVDAAVSGATTRTARTFAVADMLVEAMRPHASEAHERGIELLLDVGADVPRALSGDADEFGATVATATRAAIDGAKSDEVVVTVRNAGASGAEVALQVEVRAAGVAAAAPIVRQLRVEGAPDAAAGGAPGLRNAHLLIVAERASLRSILQDEVARAGARTEISQDFDAALGLMNGAATAGDCFALVVIALDGAGEAGHDRARKLVQKMRFSKALAKTPLLVLSPGARRDPATVGFPLNGIAKLKRPVTGAALVFAIQGLLSGS